MKLDEIKFAPLYDLDKKYALLCAGDETKYNAMTISWGGFGTIWNKPVITIYVKPIRYTFDIIENNDYFTISFYDDEYKEDLILLGTKSGRNEDKISQTKLNPQFLEKTTTFKEATITFVCKKIYYQDLIQDRVKSNIPENDYNRFYGKDPMHRMYIGEVIDIIEK